MKVIQNKSCVNIVEIMKERVCYLDSSALMHAGFTELIRRNYSIIKADGVQFHVLYSTINFLEYLTRSENIVTSAAAAVTLEKLYCLMKYQMVIAEGKPDNHYIENQQLLIAAIRHRNTKPIAFITNNRALQNDLITQNSYKSYLGNKLKIMHMSRSGYVFDSEKSLVPSEFPETEDDIDNKIMSLFRVS